MKVIYQDILSNHPAKGVILSLTAISFLSFKGILVKLAYAENISSIDLMYFRILFVLPLLWGIAFFTKGRDVINSLNFRVIISCTLAGFFGYYLATLTDFYSLKYMNANVNRVIVYTFPAYVLVWNAFIDKKMPPAKYIFAFMVVQIGLYFVLGGVDQSILNENKKGALLALVTAISYSLYIIINQQVGKTIGSILFTTYAITLSFIFINIHFFVLSEPTALPISSKGFIIILAMAVFCTFIPLLLISEGIKLIGASRLSLLSTSGPVITIIFAFLILNELLTYQQIGGALLVIIVLFFIEKKK